MKELTSRERIRRVMSNELPDRIPIIDMVWDATLLRWQKEGMPKNVDVNEFLGLDRVACILPDYSPRFEKKIIEETDDYIIETTSWGVTMKNWKKQASTPAVINNEINTSQKWLLSKKRLTASKNRIDWRYIKSNYEKWQKEGYWREFLFWFGFDVSHSWIVGTERFLMAIATEPEWVRDMFDTLVNLNIQMAEIFLSEGYDFDSIMWCDDMGYKQNQFFSLDTYKNLLKPYHKKAADWAKSKGKKIRLHSCGDIRPFLPEIIEIGIDALHPIEVKAGMNPEYIKNKFGNMITLHGGINCLLFEDYEMLKNEIQSLLPILKKNGRYIFSSDHSVPSSISIDNYKKIIKLVKDTGEYKND